MTKRTATHKLEKAGFVKDKVKHRGYTIVSGTVTNEQVQALFGTPTDRPTDHTDRPYTRWVFSDCRLSLYDDGSFVLC